jgi:hypothetical protein
MSVIPKGGGGAVTAPTSGENEHSIFVTIVAELIGISIIAIAADLNEGLGQVLMWIMIGWLLVWLILNASELQNLVGKLLGRVEVGGNADSFWGILTLIIIAFIITAILLHATGFSTAAGTLFTGFNTLGGTIVSAGATGQSGTAKKS